MKIQRGMRYRLYPTPDQVATLDEQGHAARSLWNLLHDWWTWGGRNRRPTLKQADQAIRQARQDIDWLGALPAQASQQVLKNYARAWKNFFEGRAKPPTFKSRLRSRAAVDVPQGRDLDVTKLSRRWATVKIPKVGVVRLRLHRTLPGTVTGARLLREADGWHIVFRANVEDLNIAAMTRSAKGTVEAPGRNVAQKAGLNRSIQGEAWGQLVEQLTYKTAERGGAVVRVPAPHTSQRCHACGFITPGSRESQARFACKNPQCGWGGNADVNAARNIHHAAKQAASTTAPGSGVAGRGALQPSGGAKKRQPKRKEPVP